MEHKKITPLYFFLSLGTVSTLIVSVTAFLNLAFETLNHAFPDVLTDSYQYGYAPYSYDGVRSALSLLIIVFPLYLILEHFWVKTQRSVRFGRAETFQRWAIYFILFLASVTVITDLVLMVRYFISGELSIRFVLKIAVTFLVAMKVGLYYVLRLRGTDRIAGFRVRIWAPIKASVLVAALVGWSFFVMGSPATQRALRLDERRVQDLQSIQWQIINFWQQKELLPQTLSDLANPISNYVLPRDPEFQKGKMYEYRKLGERTFELCAIFSQSMPEGWVSGYGYSTPVPVGDRVVSKSSPNALTQENWDHGEGRTCFEREIDPDLYPPNPKPAVR